MLALLRSREGGAALDYTNSRLPWRLGEEFLRDALERSARNRFRFSMKFKVSSRVWNPTIEIITKRRLFVRFALEALNSMRLFLFPEKTKKAVQTTLHSKGRGGDPVASSQSTPVLSGCTTPGLPLRAGRARNGLLGS